MIFTLESYNVYQFYYAININGNKLFIFINIKKLIGNEIG